MWMNLPTRREVVRAAAATAFDAGTNTSRPASDHEVARLASTLAKAGRRILVESRMRQAKAHAVTRPYLESTARIVTAADGVSQALMAGRYSDAVPPALTGFEMSAEVFVAAFEGASSALGQYDFGAADLHTAWVSIGDSTMDGFQLVLHHAVPKAEYESRASTFAALAVLLARWPMLEARFTFLMRHILSMETPDPEEDMTDLEVCEAGVVLESRARVNER